MLSLSNLSLSLPLGLPLGLPLWVWTHGAAFCLGLGSALVVLVAGVILYIHWLPYYVLPLKAHRPLIPQHQLAQQTQQLAQQLAQQPAATTGAAQPSDPNFDPHLNRCGWIRVSLVPLSEQELFCQDDPLPALPSLPALGPPGAKAAGGPLPPAHARLLQHRSSLTSRLKGASVWLPVCLSVRRLPIAPPVCPRLDG
ncbi:hypothetical protein BC831DRAFT_428784 [Entophlyctis helioformis]|nr:hypothetical protein BC831DRAFT_428784 [Entophlyctis helioformis]